MSIAFQRMDTVEQRHGFRPEPVSVNLEAGFVELGPSAAGIRSINGDLVVGRHCVRAVEQGWLDNPNGIHIYTCLYVLHPKSLKAEREAHPHL